LGTFSKKIANGRLPYKEAVGYKEAVSHPSYAVCMPTVGG